MLNFSINLNNDIYIKIIEKLVFLHDLT